MEINFEISDKLKRALDDMGFESLTEIQQKAIPLILDGKDVVGKSQTGSGKTVAFGLPAISAIDKDINKKYTQVLVLVPTRELAIQVCSEIRRLMKYTHDIKTVAVYGGQMLSKQIPLMRQGSQIVVGTPGRVMDHIERKTLKLQDLKMIVLDEADEMLNMGFCEDIEKILKATPAERQTVLFSATMPKEIMDITHNYQKEPVLIEVARKQMTVDTIKQFAVECPKGKKIDALCHILDKEDVKLGIVFCNTKKMVDMLVPMLAEKGIVALGLHGDMRQRDRDKVMKEFRKGGVQLLVATDVAARGIDVNNVDAVFNYDIPLQTEYYVHRIGRTGRAGKAGESYTFIVDKRQLMQMGDIIRAVKAKIEPYEIAELKTEKSTKEKAEKTPKEKGQKADKKENAFFKNKEKGGKSKKGVAEKISDFYPMRLSIGRKSGVSPKQILGAVTGESGVNGREIGAIHIGDMHTTVEIPFAKRSEIIRKVNGAKIKGKKVSAK
ncbi:MAG: DEAD/DEAH box helicase [Oscillospiraceae bacterium]|nr:DEAD/DEAH box helicase [Oscillospiraceae bacterium]